MVNCANKLTQTAPPEKRLAPNGWNGGPCSASHVTHSPHHRSCETAEILAWAGGGAVRTWLAFLSWKRILHATVDQRTATASRRREPILGRVLLVVTKTALRSLASRTRHLALLGVFHKRLWGKQLRRRLVGNRDVRGDIQTLWILEFPQPGCSPSTITGSTGSAASSRNPSRTEFIPF
jgi:hypothetical protein